MTSSSLVGLLPRKFINVGMCLLDACKPSFPDKVPVVPLVNWRSHIVLDKHLLALLEGPIWRRWPLRRGNISWRRWRLRNSFLDDNRPWLITYHHESFNDLTSSNENTSADQQRAANKQSCEVCSAKAVYTCINANQAKVSEQRRANPSEQNSKYLHLFNPLISTKARPSSSPTQQSIHTIGQKLGNWPHTCASVGMRSGQSEIAWAPLPRVVAGPPGARSWCMGILDRSLSRIARQGTRSSKFDAQKS